MKHQHANLIRFCGDSALWNDRLKKLAASQFWQFAGLSQGTIHGGMIALELDRNDKCLVTLGVFINERDILLATAHHKKTDVAINNAYHRLQSYVQQPQPCPA